MLLKELDDGILIGGRPDKDLDVEGHVGDGPPKEDEESGGGHLFSTAEGFTATAGGLGSLRGRSPAGRVLLDDAGAADELFDVLEL